MLQPQSGSYYFDHVTSVDGNNVSGGNDFSMTSSAAVDRRHASHVVNVRGSRPAGTHSDHAAVASGVDASRGSSLRQPPSLQFYRPSSQFPPSSHQPSLRYQNQFQYHHMQPQQQQQQSDIQLITRAVNPAEQSVTRRRWSDDPNLLSLASSVEPSASAGNPAFPVQNRSQVSFGVGAFDGFCFSGSWMPSMNPRSVVDTQGLPDIAFASALSYHPGCMPLSSSTSSVAALQTINRRHGSPTASTLPFSTSSQYGAPSTATVDDVTSCRRPPFGSVTMMPTGTEAFVGGQRCDYDFPGSSTGFVPTWETQTGVANALTTAATTTLMPELFQSTSLPPADFAAASSSSSTMAPRCSIPPAARHRSVMMFDSASRQSAYQQLQVVDGDVAGVCFDADVRAFNGMASRGRSTVLDDSDNDGDDDDDDEEEDDDDGEDNNNEVKESKHRFVFGVRPTPASMSVGKTRTREKYRTVYSERQKVYLESEYVANTYISAERKASIATATGLTERQVKIWFQNRRAKDRRTRYRNTAACTSTSGSDN